MAAKLERTSTPGVYRRHSKGCRRDGRCNCSYVVVYLVDGRQRTDSYVSLADARRAKDAAARRARLVKAHADDLHLDEPREECPSCAEERRQRDEAQPTLHAYAREWIDRYQGTGNRGFRDQTRDEYRAQLERFALRYFPPDLKLAELTPRMVADFIAWLTLRPTRRGGTLADASVRTALKPLAACTATATREDTIPQNPCAKAVLPHRARIEEDDARARPFPGRVMEHVVELVPPRHRLMFELLAATGLRRSELLALEGRHLDLTSDQPCVKVRQRVRRQKGKGLVIGPLKSRHARRDLPILPELAERLGARATPTDALVFPSDAGTLLCPNNVNNRILAPACAEAGVEWARCHTFRHTVASRLFDEGRNAKRVQHWLGHHAASFTLDTYVHLLDEDLGEPLATPRVNVRSIAGAKQPQNDSGALRATAAG